MAQAVNDGDSGLIVKDTGSPLPLKALSISGDVKGYVLGLSVSLTYENDTSNPVEVVYRMPLDPSQAVVGLTAIIDKRTIRAELKEKQEARDVYDDAIASGGTAALAEEKSKDIFSISLGNLPSESKAEIQLELVGELPIDAEGRVEFSVGTALKQRYTPQGHVDILAPLAEGSKSENFKTPPEFELRVHKKDVSEVVSATHSLTTSEGNDEVILVKLADGERLSRNLVIQIVHESPHVPVAITEPGQPQGDKGKGADFSNSVAMSISFFPQIPRQSEEAACELIFLVDRSGSMHSLISSTSESLVLFLKSIPEGCHFNVYGFGSRFVKLFPSSVPYTQESLDEATSHAQKIAADLGGTEILSPLREICSLPLIPGLPRQIFILTDGAVSNTAACISHIRSNPHVRCFTFGMGTGASAELVKGMAEAGKGTAEFVMEGERLQPKVTRSLKHALQPSLSNVTISFDIPAVPDCDTIVAPHSAPPVFDGDKLVVYGILTPKSQPVEMVSGTAILKGTLLGEEVVHTVPFDVDFRATSSDAFMPIHRMAGKALLHDMEQAQTAADELVQMSKETGVLCKETAFVAVDEVGMELQQPLQAPMVSYDLMATVASVKALMASNIDRAIERGERLDSLQEQSECLNESARVFLSASRPRSGFRSALSSVSASVSGWFHNIQEWVSSSSSQSQEEVKVSDAAPRNCAKDLGTDVDQRRNSICDNSSDDDSCSDVEGESLTKEEASPSESSPTADLASIVLAQQANGAWSPESAAKAVGKPVSALSRACPTGCDDVVWATVVVLAVLGSWYGSQKDEWELVAKKATAWIQKQSLPDTISTDSLHTAAQQFIKQS